MKMHRYKFYTCLPSLLAVATPANYVKGVASLTKAATILL
jgi:hypothetical protein